MSQTQKGFVLRYIYNHSFVRALDFFLRHTLSRFWPAFAAGIPAWRHHQCFKSKKPVMSGYSAVCYSWSAEQARFIFFFPLLVKLLVLLKNYFRGVYLQVVGQSLESLIFT
jgi:hypothetical protein